MIIDISRSQSKINWDVARLGLQMVCVKASQGVQRSPKREAYFMRACAACRSRGLPVTGYHYATRTDSASEQAQLFRRMLAAGKCNETPVLDYEGECIDTPAHNTWLADFLGAFDAPLIFYTYRSACSAFDHETVSMFPRLWVASRPWGDAIPPRGVELLERQPLDIGPWANWFRWQFASKGGRWAGVDGAVDLSVQNDSA
jgi:GH25 family lysozyme M1 (1,4-beta-N-acetylmuramidase)